MFSSAQNQPSRPGQYIARLNRPLATQNDSRIEKLSDDFVLVNDSNPYALFDAEQVDYVVPNHMYRRQRPQESENIPKAQWGLHNTGQDGGKVDADIDAPEAWKTTTGKTLVAVLDTGIDTTHPDLQKTLYRNKGELAGDGIDNDGNGIIDDVNGYDAAMRTGNPWSDDPHGCHCAGTIAAAGEVVGVAPTATVLPIKIYDDEDWTDAATIIRALDYARKAGAKIASHSYGGLIFNAAVRDAFAQPDMLHIVAAGNYRHNNDEKMNYPSSYNLPNMISVAASDRNDNIASFSNYGPKTVHLAAPGVDILSTTSYGNHGSWSGTSMAAPHVAGAAALVATVYPEDGPVGWKSRILDNVDVQSGWEDRVGTGGRLNAAKALQPK